MASVDVSPLHWDSFARVVAECDFDSLVKKLENTRSPFFKGLAIFQKNDEESTAALRRRAFTRNGSDVEIKAEWIDDACAISQHLRLHAYQSYLLRSFLGEDVPSADSSTICAKARVAYFAERLTLLRSIRDVLHEHMTRDEEMTEELRGVVARQQTRELIQQFTMELIAQLKARSPRHHPAPAPITAGEKELHVLVDILLLGFRRRCCSVAQVFEFCTAMKHLSISDVSEQLYAKLTLLPMLGYGLWKLLELKPTERHPLYEEYGEMDKFFVEWSFEDNSPQNSLVHISWHLFRSIYTPTQASSSDAASTMFVSDIGLHCVPPLMKSMLAVMEGATEESLVRECLLVIMGACLHESSFLSREELSWQAFEVISDICHGSRLSLCNLVGTCGVSRLLCEMTCFINLNPNPAMTLFLGFCHPETAPFFAEYLKENVKDVVVLHSQSDLRSLHVDAVNGNLIASRYLEPSIGFQVCIPQGTRGSFHCERVLDWMLPSIPETVLVRWQAFSVGVVFMFSYQRCIDQLRSGGRERANEVVGTAQRLVRFAVAFLDSTKLSESRFLPFQKLNRTPGKDRSLVEDTVHLLEIFHCDHQPVSDVLGILKHFCRHSPTEVLNALDKSSFFQRCDDTESRILRMLTLKDDFQPPANFHQAEAVICLLTEFVKQRHILEGLPIWIRVICDKVLPRLREPSADAHLKSKASLLCQVTEFLRWILFLESETLLTLEVKRRIRTGFCIQDTVEASLKLIPRRLGVVHRYQTRLVISLCEFLTELLNGTIVLETEMLRKVTRSLLVKGYWDSKSPTARLALFTGKATASDTFHRLDIKCSLAALRFFTAMLHQFETHKDSLEGISLMNALPFDGPDLDPAFQSSVLLSSYYRGRPIDNDVMVSAMNLLIVASSHDSEFLSFLVFPSILHPVSEVKEPSLMDVAWRSVSNHHVLFREQPTLLCGTLRALRALQRNPGQKGQQAWEILKGQDRFFEVLIDIALKPRSTDDEGEVQELDRFREVHEHCVALALEILSAELKHTRTNTALSNALSSVRETKWEEWIELVNVASSMERDEEIVRGMITLANVVAYEILAAVSPEGHARGCSLPWTEELQNVQFKI